MDVQLINFREEIDCELYHMKLTLDKPQTIPYVILECAVRKLRANTPL